MSSFLQSTEALKDRLIWLMLVVGLLFPTSYGGSTSSAYKFAATAFFICLAFFWGQMSFARVTPVLAMFVILLAFTITSYLFQQRHDITIGAAVPFMGLGILLCSDFSKTKLSPFSAKFFRVLSWLVLVMAGLVLVGYQPFNSFLVNYYSDFYADLVPRMLQFHKPVLFFASHSIAALGAYLFFYLNLRSGHRFIAFCFILMCFALTSFSGFGMGTLALLQFVVVVYKRRPILTSFLVIAISAIVGTQIIRYWDTILLYGQSVISFSTNGVIARYGPGGNLRPALEYIQTRPYAPIGLTHSENMLVGDSGPIEFLLRGSVILLVLIYVLFAAFLFRNLRSRRDATLLLITFLLFDLGYTSLTYFRFWYLLVFGVVYLNSFYEDIDSFQFRRRLSAEVKDFSSTIRRAAARSAKAPTVTGEY